jgi:molecular chaperone GrpE
VLDDLQRVAHVDPAITSVGSLLDGVQLVERKLQRALTAAGLEEVSPQDERFDPASMEALMTVDADGPEQDETVAGVLQKGYRFKGQLLRPARVQVRKYHG